MANRNKQSLVKKLIIIAVVLGLAETAVLITFKQEPPRSIQEAIKNDVGKKTGLSDERKERLKVQLAISDYMSANNGVPPANLSMLIPKYFDTVPIDPSTGSEYQYEVKGNRFFVGSHDAIQVAKKDDKATSTVESEKTALEKSADLTEEQQTALIDSLTEDERLNYVYDPTGKSDPFRPFNFAPEVKIGSTPLEGFAYSQLKLTAVLEGFGEPAALIETADGKGYTVKKGAKIGNSGGEIVEIFSDKIVILESLVDFTGEKSTKRIEMTLRTAQ